MSFKNFYSVSPEEKKKVAFSVYNLINTKEASKKKSVINSFKKKAKTKKNTSVFWSLVSVIIIAASGSNLLSYFPSLSSSSIFFNVSVLLFYVYILYSEQKTFISNKIILKDINESFNVLKDYINNRFINEDYNEVFEFSYALLDKKSFRQLLEENK